MADSRAVYLPVKYRAGSTQTINYGFSTRIEATESTELGQIDLASAAPTGALVFGANRPKPNRATKKNGSAGGTGTTGKGATTSSFVADGAMNTARAAGWKISYTGKGAGPRKSANKTAVFVEVAGIKYAWMIPDRLLTYGSQVGFAPVQGTDEVIFGARAPKPAVFSKILGSSGGVTTTVSTFGDPTTAAASGWSEIKGAKLS